MTGPLEGLRVVDCSRGTAGPRASGILADYGADVIWVEPPGGDPYRRRLAVEYSVFNRGKRSITLDVQADHDALLDLLATADVFIENCPPGRAEAAGLGFADLHRRLPGLVHCSITGFGTDGPHRDVPGYEAIVHAIAGTMGEQVGHREPPIFEGLPFASIGAAYLAVMGVLAALYRRADDGTGRYVETSMLDGALVYLAMLWGDTDADQTQAAHMVDTYLPGGRTRMITGSFLCADDEYIGVHTGAVGAFGRLMTVLGLDDRIVPSADGMDMGVALTPEEQAVLESEIHGIFGRDPREIWVKRLLDTDVCGVPVLRPGEVLDEPQIRFNEMVIVVDDPVLGKVDQIAPPIKFSETPGGVTGPAPRTGEHSAEVLAEVRRPRPEVPWMGSGPTNDAPLLDGVKVLDLGAFYAGPCSSRHLADFGADVIKVEPIAGDMLRGLPGLFRAAQAGKRALAANMKAEELGPAREKLLAWADIVHHNMRPGAAERLGLGRADAQAANPGLIYGYAPGWGSTGPWSTRQSFEPMISGYVGVQFEVAGQFNPPIYPLGNADPGNGLLGAVAMLMALLDRKRRGRPQHFENPQLNATLTHMEHIVRDGSGAVLGAGRLDPLQFGHSALERLYQTADGWLCLVAAKDAHITGLSKVIGIDLLADERFRSNNDRGVNDYELATLVGDAFLTMTTATALQALVDVGVPAAEPRSYNNRAFLTDPENRRTGRVAECPHPIYGLVRELAQYLRVSDARVPPHRLAPELGADNDALLTWLGFDPETISSLRGRRLVR